MGMFSLEVYYILAWTVSSLDACSMAEILWYAFKNSCRCLYFFIKPLTGNVSLCIHTYL